MEENKIHKENNGIIINEDQVKSFILSEDILENPKIFYDNFQEWKYKMRLGKQVYISTDDVPKSLGKGEYFSIKPGDFVFMIFFQTVCGCKAVEHKGYDSIPAEMIEMIKGKSATLSSNATRLDHLEFYLKIVGGFSISLLVVLVGIAIREIIK